MLIAAFRNAFAPPVVLYTCFGVVLGVTVGAIPGLTTSMAIVVLLPLVYKLAPAVGLGMLMGVYKGSIFGGSISAISFGVPGTPAAAATMQDGYQAKLKGYPRRALYTALCSSVTGDTLSDFVLIFVAMPLAIVALKFGPREFFALYVFALMLIALLAQGKITKGLAAGAIGLLIGCIGSDPVSGAQRLTFGIRQLRGGIALIPLLIGIFAMPELLIQFLQEWHKVRSRKIEEMVDQASDILGYDASKDRYTFKTYLSTFKATMIGTGVGTFIGALPGAGSTLAAYISYSLAQRFSKNPEKFGKGCLEGVAAPEAGNNATVGPCLIPLFAFGIPGSAIAALFAVALMMQGVSLGPLMLVENAPLMHTFFVTLIYANIVNLGISRLLIPLYAKISLMPKRYLVPIVIAFAVIGTYASRNSVGDVFVLLIAGIAGVFLRKHEFPLAPLVLGYVVGPGAERALMQALAIGRGDLIFVFLKSPISIALYISAILIVFLLRKTLRIGNRSNSIDTTKSGESSK